MFKKHILSYVENAEMNQALQLLERQNVHMEEDIFAKTYRFELGKFRWTVRRLNFLTYPMGNIITIKVEDILVFRFNWRYDMPLEMKQEFKKELEKIKAFNALCKQKKLKKQYVKHQKMIKKGKEQKEMAAYLRECERLKQIFKA